MPTPTTSTANHSGSDASDRIHSWEVLDGQAHLASKFILTNQQEVVMSTESNFIIVDQDKNATGAPAGEVDPAQEPRNYFHHPFVSSALEQIGYPFWSKDIRPWSEFFQRKNLALPKNFEDTKSRIQRNSSHFYANYAVVVLVIAAIALMSQPLLLLGLIVSVAAVSLG
jgi:hypothetical protein